MSEESKLYPEYTPLREMPITASIPYIFRWKILNAKLLLADIETLAYKYKLENATLLYTEIKKEVDELCLKILADIKSKQEMREKLVKD